MRKYHMIILCLCVLALAFFLWVLWGNTALELNTYSISHPELPESFDGLRIAHISDLHNAEMGKDNENLLSMLRNAEPDLIAITGDMIDSRRTNVGVALALAREAVKIAPCYYVPGNHEGRIPEYESFKSDLQDAGVTVLEDAAVRYVHDDAYITIWGVRDPTFHADWSTTANGALVGRVLNELSMPEDGFTILLSHRPELFDVYTTHKISLALCGHAHGGQFRLPWIGGLMAPNQGFFPEYDGGLYTSGNTNMVVSRGIGNSAFPLRFNNRPEVALIELHTP